MEKNYYFFVDDNIWVFRDLARERPSSLFENSYLKIFKNLHNLFGLKVQLNLFYQDDFYYGGDEFNLSMMPDCYKDEWKANSDWLKLAFHARQEFPDNPYVNASYKLMKNDFEKLRAEVFRFAGEDSFSYVTNPHWIPVSFEGCKALYDSGVRILGSSYGELYDTEDAIDKLPYGHKGRLLQNKKPESGIFNRNTADTAINFSLKSYNHLNPKNASHTYLTNDCVFDEKTGLKFKRFCTGLVLNLYEVSEIKDEISKYLNNEYIGVGIHEQYYYKNYYAYQPDFEEKLYTAFEYLKNNGYKSVFLEEIIKTS